MWHSLGVIQIQRKQSYELGSPGKTPAGRNGAVKDAPDFARGAKDKDISVVGK